MDFLKFFKKQDPTTLRFKRIRRAINCAHEDALRASRGEETKGYGINCSDEELEKALVALYHRQFKKSYDKLTNGKPHRQDFIGSMLNTGALHLFSPEELEEIQKDFENLHGKGSIRRDR